MWAFLVPESIIFDNIPSIPIKPIPIIQYPLYEPPRALQGHSIAPNLQQLKITVSLHQSNKTATIKINHPKGGIYQMEKHISNMSQLQKALQPVMKNMVGQLAERVYETLNYYLNDYYTGWTPESYRRTEAFLRSAVKVDAYPDKGGARACVYIDYDSMDDYVDTTGYQVALWADQGLHGGLPGRR